MSKPLAITIDQYLKDPSTCVYCGSDNIVGDVIDADSIYAYRNVKCIECEKVLTETFTLTNITLEDESSSIN